MARRPRAPRCCWPASSRCGLRFRPRAACACSRWACRPVSRCRRPDMRPIRLDFVRTGPAAGVGSLFALGVGAAALGVALWSSSMASTEHDALVVAARAQDPNAERLAAPLDESRRRVREADAKRAAAVIASLSVPWPNLFMALEASAGRGVVVTGLQPEAEARRVRITGEARRFEDIPLYAKQLQETRTFA